MTPEQLNEIEQRANRATEAPWTVSETVDETEYGSYTACGVQPIAPLEWYSDSDMAHVALEPMEEEDAKFIAAARTDVPNLVAEVRRLQGQIVAVEKLHRPSTEKVDGAGVTYRMCLHCTYINRYGQQRYPCPTIRIVGENNE